MNEIKTLAEVKPLKDVERRYIMRALVTLKWNKTHTAMALGISIRTLRIKLAKYRLDDRVRKELEELKAQAAGGAQP